MAGGYNIKRRPLKKEHLRDSESGVLYPLVRGIIFVLVWDKTKYREVSIWEGPFSESCIRGFNQTSG